MAARAERIALILLAAGSGRRMGCNKMLLSIAGKTPLALCAAAFARCETDFSPVVVAVSEQTRAEAARAFPEARLILGGERRAASVRRALDAVDTADIVVIHDAARCLVTPEVIEGSIDAAIAYGSGVAAVAARDTVRCGGEIISREEVLLAQTPQTFDLARIRDAYARLGDAEATDDAAIYALAGYTPHFCAGSLLNQKLTAPEDIPFFEALGRVLCE